MQAISKYEARAAQWLKDHGITYGVTKLGEERGFNDEKPKPGRGLLWHDTYSAVFRRTTTGNGHQPARIETLEIPKFYQSAARSRAALTRAHCICGRVVVHDRDCPRSAVKVQAPRAYDLLACLTKYDPGTFSDFCSDFGYDEDSRSAERTYFAVQEEWTRVRRFFTADELEELHEVAS